MQICHYGNIRNLFVLLPQNGTQLGGVCVCFAMEYCLFFLVSLLKEYKLISFGHYYYYYF